MVKLLKGFGYFVFFILALMYFTPKVALYYFAEEQMKSYSVIVSGESAVDNGFTLSIKDSSVSFKAIESAKIKSIDIAVFGLYNNIHVDDVTLASTAASFVPTDVKYVDISYSIFNPLNVVATAEGGFGVANVLVNILDRELIVKLEPSKIMSTKYKSTLRNLKKSKDGGYEYAKNF